MSRTLFGASRPLVIAHRGASAYAPENTMAAFELALQQGADGVELDAKLSADGEVVVIHDPTLQRTTGVKGRVDSFTLAELRTLDAGGHFSAEYRGERIPTLDEVFERLGGKCLIDIELTNYTSPRDGLVEKVAALIARYHLEDSICCTSFFPANLRRARRKLPGVPVGMLAWSGPLGWLARGYLGRRAAPGLVLPYFADCTPAYVRRQRGLGRFIIPWTVDDVAVAERLLAAGVNGIITNDPPVMRRVILGGGEV